MYVFLLAEGRQVTACMFILTAAFPNQRSWQGGPGGPHGGAFLPIARTSLGATQEQRERTVC